MSLIVVIEGLIIIGLLTACVTLKSQLDALPKRDKKGRFTKKSK